MTHPRQGGAWSRWICLPLSALLAVGPAVSHAQEPPAPQYTTTTNVRGAFNRQQLEQMLAPIALYPDALLSQILMAATYPLEVVEAARWSRAHPDLNAEAATQAVASQPWDPSVKSLVAFPRVLVTMSERLQWTQDLGDAFLEQQPQVMETVQRLRRIAWTAGSLRSSDEVRVDERDQSIVIEAIDPRIAYVPYYDPVVAYGPWSWPAYPPVRWAPWPGYYAGRDYSNVFLWGPAIVVPAAFFFGAFDWHRRHSVVVHDHGRRIYTQDRYRRNWEPASSVWRHDRSHRTSSGHRAADRTFDAQPDGGTRLYRTPQAASSVRNHEHPAMIGAGAAAAALHAEREAVRARQDAFRQNAPHGIGDRHARGQAVAPANAERWREQRRSLTTQQGQSGPGLESAGSVAGNERNARRWQQHEMSPRAGASALEARARASDPGRWAGAGRGGGQDLNARPERPHVGSGGTHQPRAERSAAPQAPGAAAAARSHQGGTQRRAGQ